MSTPLSLKPSGESSTPPPLPLNLPPVPRPHTDSNLSGKWRSILLEDTAWVVTCIPETGHQQVRLPLYIDLQAAGISSTTVEGVASKDIPKEVYRLTTAFYACQHKQGELSPEVPWAQYRIIECKFGDCVVDRSALGCDTSSWGIQDWSNLNKCDVLALDVVFDTSLGGCARGIPLGGSKDVAKDAVRGSSHYDRHSAGTYVALAADGLRNAQGVAKTCLAIPGPLSSGDTTRYLTLDWMRDDNPLAVDLAVDFGNTRTCVLALENHGGASLNKSLRPILFMEDAMPYSTTAPGAENTADSYLVLREPVLTGINQPIAVCDYELRKSGGLFGFGKKDERVWAYESKVLPHQFAALSPALMGRAGKKQMRQIDPAHGNFTLSSPKRYLWDNDRLTGAAWTMLAKESSETSRKEAPLRGPILRFLAESDRPVSAFGTLNLAETQAKPSHPRAQAMTWAALGILESAYRQINSHNWREGHQRNQRRYLRNVAVTFPAGWTEGEVEQYRRRWQDAVEIFALSRLAEPGNPPDHDRYPGRPLLQLGDQHAPDEAVVAQLPFIFSEMARLDARGDNWLEVYGRPRAEAGVGAPHAVRVMSIDIGGGTTDLSILEYGDRTTGTGIALSIQPLFRDSVAIAGDRVVQQILVEVILPALVRDAGPEQQAAFKKFMAGQTGQKSDHRSQYAPMIWDPLVRGILSEENPPEDYNTGLRGCPEKWGVTGEWLDEFQKDLIAAGITTDFTRTQFTLSTDAVRRCWIDTFTPLAQSWAAYCAALEVDLVLVSGKPSEQEAIRSLLREVLPVSPSRVIFAKGFEAGDWWPMGDRKIEDAKHVTAVGLALYGQILRGGRPGWSIRTEPSKKDAWWNRNHWGKLSLNTKRQRILSNDILLKPEDDETASPVSIQVGTRIGRQLLKDGGSADFVYELRWKDPARRNGDKIDAAGNSRPVLITLAREVESTGERLVLKSATDETGKDLSAEIELRLNNMAEAEHWRDTGKFDIQLEKKTRE